ncbi:MAG TPA: MFS transporter, partial [Bacillales bacterium]|nr:MFS transporter [Bacillales bacterium]
MKIRTYLHQFHSAIWIQVFGNGLMAFVNSLLLPFLTLYIYQNVQQNILLTTLVVGIQPFTEMVLTVVAGGWTDRWGRRRLMIISLIVQVLAVGGLFFAANLWIFALLTMMNGFG